MNKLYTFGLGGFTRFFILLLIGVSVCVLFTRGNLDDITIFVLLTVIFFGAFILLIISNIATVVSFINSNSYQEITSTEDIVQGIENQQDSPIEKKVEIRPYVTHLIKSSLTNGKLNGDFQEFNSDGFMISRGNYLNGLRTGEWMFYTDEGDLLAIGNFKNGKKHGDWKILNVNNKDGRYPDAPEFVLQESYVDGIISDGTWRYFHWDGCLAATGQIVNGLRNGEWRGYPSKTAGAYTKAIFKNGVVYPTFILGTSSNVFNVDVSWLYSNFRSPNFIPHINEDAIDIDLVNGLLNEGFKLFHFRRNLSTGFYRNRNRNNSDDIYDEMGEFRDWLKDGSWYYEECRNTKIEHFDYGHKRIKLFGKIPITHSQESSLEKDFDYYLKKAFDCFEFKLERYYSCN